MLRPPDRSLIPAVSILVVATVFVAPAAAQQPETGMSPAGEAVVAALITLVVGGGLILLTPGYTERTTQRILDHPGEALLYGIAIGLLATIVLVILILSVIGILLAIPLIIVLVVFGELGYLAVGRLVTDNWGIVLLVAMGTSAVAGGVPVLGALLAIILSSLGIGAAYLDYRDDGANRSSGADRPAGGATGRSRPRR